MTDPSKVRRSKIVIDLSNNPLQEMQLVAVLSAMVRKATACDLEVPGSSNISLIDLGSWLELKSVVSDPNL